MNRGEDKSTDNDFNWDEPTQKIHSPFSQGDNDANAYVCGKESTYDPFLLEDGFETQLASLAGETQVVDYDGETQLLDDPDLDKLTRSPVDCNADVEIAHVSDSEETNITDDFCDTQKVSEHDDDADSFSQKKQYAGVFEPSNDTCKMQKRSSGSMQRGFPSIRTSSFRAAGLEARARAPNVSIPSPKNNKYSLDEGKFENDKEIENAKNKISSTAARRLFMDDDANVDAPDDNLGNTQLIGSQNCLMEDDANVEAPDDNLGNTQLIGSQNCLMEDKAYVDAPDDNLENTQLIGSQNCLAGLSYVNSDQPGELSQANAIEAVEKFLEQSLHEFDQGTARKLHVVENPKLVSGAKGSRDLAKSSNLRKIVGVGGIFDWDDNREDEGGGEFFVKKKELLVDKVVGKVKPRTEPKKQNCSDLRNIKSVGKYEGGEQKTCNKRKLVDSVRSVTRNLSKDLDGVMNFASESKLAENEASKSNQAMDDIGPDTQIAAEAIENLRFESHLVDDNANCQVTKTSKSINNSSRAERSLIRKRECDTSVEVVTRRAKKATKVNASKRSSISSMEQSIPARNGHDKELGQKSVKERSSFLHDQLGFTVPVAHRTRKRKKCAESNHSKDAETVVDTKKKTNDLVDDPNPSSKKRRAFKDKNVQMITIERLKSLRSTKRVESRSNLDELRFESSKCSGRREKNDKIETSPRERAGTTFSTRTPPATCCTTPIKDASPVIMGDEYLKQSCRTYHRSFSHVREVNSLITGLPISPDGMKEGRKRRDVTSIRVLFSQHLNVDVIKQQKKVLGRLGAAVASSMSDATHFVADEFVRTRNMLEAIAFGKPVVTRLWLENCGQASCVVDEKKYILRDMKKEKELGFNMPGSLSQACQHPLMLGHKVLITPNTKPGKDILASLVKAVHGLAVERLGRSVLMGEKLPDDLLIISCEEDLEACVPYLEKGGAVYSSELVLNGIVKQKLEFDRHRLFEDHVKRTRSTLWVKKKRSARLSASKCS